MLPFWFDRYIYYLNVLFLNVIFDVACCLLHSYTPKLSLGPNIHHFREKKRKSTTKQRQPDRQYMKLLHITHIQTHTLLFFFFSTVGIKKTQWERFRHDKGCSWDLNSVCCSFWLVPQPNKPSGCYATEPLGPLLSDN